MDGTPHGPCGIRPSKSHSDFKDLVPEMLRISRGTIPRGLVLLNAAHFVGHARGTFIDSDSKSLRTFVPNFLAAVGVIPPTAIACPLSDIPPSSFFFAFIHGHGRGLLRRRDKTTPWAVAAKYLLANKSNNLPL